MEIDQLMKDFATVLYGQCSEWLSLLSSSLIYLRKLNTSFYF